MEKKPASFVVVFLIKSLNRKSPFSCGRQVGGLNCLSVMVVQFDKKTSNHVSCSYL